MVFDTSGSMNDLDRTGISKIDAAKRAGSNILDILEAEASSTMGFSGRIGLVRFSSDYETVLPLTDDLVNARQVLQSFSPQGSTRMAGGLREGIDMLANVPTASRPVMILLSDGLPNVTLAGVGLGDYDPVVRQEVLDLAAEAGQRGICIYTVGFGEPLIGGGSIDEDLLRQIAAASGCGAYYNALDANQLANVYVELRHISTGNILLRNSGPIAQGQTVEIGTVQVPPDQLQMLFTLNWPGSRLEPVLLDPNSRSVDSNYPGASFATYSSLASVIIQNPLPGQWQLSVRGVDVPEGQTTYNAILSARPNPATSTPTSTPTPQPPVQPGLPIVVLLLLVGGGGIFLYVLAQTARKSRALPSSGGAFVGGVSLVGIAGEVIGRSTPVSDGMVIGRGAACQLRLSERAVSRQHASLRYAQGQWFIQDLQSTTGTWVNGQRVTASALKNGDHIRIGSSEFEFRV